MRGKKPMDDEKPIRWKLVIDTPFTIEGMLTSKVTGVELYIYKSHTLIKIKSGEQGDLGYSSANIFINNKEHALSHYANHCTNEEQCIMYAGRLLFNLEVNHAVYYTGQKPLHSAMWSIVPAAASAAAPPSYTGLLSSMPASIQAPGLTKKEYGIETAERLRQEMLLNDRKLGGSRRKTKRHPKKYRKSRKTHGKRRH